jgi:hypothetical protein
LNLFFLYEISDPFPVKEGLETIGIVDAWRNVWEGNNMSESSWWQRNGAVFTSVIALVSILTYLHVSLGTIRDELRTEVGGLRTEMGGLRAEMREELTELRASLDRVETELRASLDRVGTDLRTSLDRVETKVDEVRGYLRFNPSATHNELPPQE